VVADFIVGPDFELESVNFNLKFITKYQASSIAGRADHFLGSCSENLNANLFCNDYLFIDAQFYGFARLADFTKFLAGFLAFLALALFTVLKPKLGLKAILELARLAWEKPTFLSLLESVFGTRHTLSLSSCPLYFQKLCLHFLKLFCLIIICILEFLLY
jgi:hypothetical protein